LTSKIILVGFWRSYEEQRSWVLMELNNPNTLSIYGLRIELNRQYKGEMNSNWSIDFKHHSCWFLKVLGRTKKLGFDGIKETQCTFNLRSIYSNWKAIVRRIEVKLKHWVKRSFLLVFEGLKKNKEVGFWWN
jgi:hypothetical protein